MGKKKAKFVNQSKDSAFVEDCKCKAEIYNYDTHRTHVEELPAMSISQSGGCFFVIDMELNDGIHAYGLTHGPTGWAVVKAKVGADVKLLKTTARRLWRALSKDARLVWKATDPPSTPKEIMNATNMEARAVAINAR